MPGQKILRESSSSLTICFSVKKVQKQVRLTSIQRAIVYGDCQPSVMIAHSQVCTEYGFQALDYLVRALLTAVVSLPLS